VTTTQHKIDCYWWATINGLKTECDAQPSLLKKVVEWPRSGTNCQFCGKVMAYATNEADAKSLRSTGANVAWKHKA
jgi:hypothetical protein